MAVFIVKYALGKPIPPNQQMGDTVSLDTLETLGRAAFNALFVAWTMTGIVRIFAVGQTKLRYWLTTTCIVLDTGLEVTIAVRAVVALMKHNYGEAGGWLLPAFATLLGLYALFIDDDGNWFNDQFKKLKRFGTRLRNIRITLPSPMPSPA